MTRIAKSELHDEPLLSIPAVIDRVDAIHGDDVHELAATLLSEPATLTLIGPFADAG
jgi:hypothetical protein